MLKFRLKKAEKGERAKSENKLSVKGTLAKTADRIKIACSNNIARIMAWTLFILAGLQQTSFAISLGEGAAFFTEAINCLKVLVIAIGIGLGGWGIVNLMEGYGNDNRATRFRTNITLF